MLPPEKAEMVASQYIVKNSNHLVDQMVAMADVVEILF
jgi:hypothetical protein